MQERKLYNTVPDGIISKLMTVIAENGLSVAEANNVPAYLRFEIEMETMRLNGETRFTLPDS